MNIVNKLLEGADPEALKNYESYVQLHLKYILTTINKHKLEDTTAIKVKQKLLFSLRSISATSTATTTSGRTARTTHLARKWKS
jgi:hypothetical protein